MDSRWLGWRVLALLKPHRGTILALAFLIVFVSALDIAVPFLTKGLIDKILHALGSSQATSLRSLFLAAGSIFVATAGSRLLRSLYNYKLVMAASQAEDEAKNGAFANYLRLDTEYHSSVNTGEIVGALDRGGTAIFIVLNEVLGQNLLPPLLIAAGVLISLLVKNPWIALIVFVPLPAYLLAISRLATRLHKAEHEVNEAFEKVTKESYDISSNVRLVKRFARETEEAAEQRRLLRVARGKHYAAERIWALTENLQSFIATAGRVGVIATGGFLVLTHRCTVGDYVLFIAMQDMIYGPISQLSIIFPKLRRNLSRAERLFEIASERPLLLDVPGADELPEAQCSVEFRGVSFCYAGTERLALNNVNLCVPAGTTVALIGTSGSGKSTLVSLLQRLYDPEQGQVLINGRDIRHVTQRSLRERIAVVPQEIELFARSIATNIGYGREGLSKAAIEEAAQLAHAHEFIVRQEQGYGTQVGERGAKLSGGERQRLGIARAIARDPKILILDEATSHLDNESERLIQQAMERVTKGRTCFIIAHRLSTVRQADMVVVMNHGSVEAVGSHEQLWHSSPTYRKLHGIHVVDRPATKPQEAADEYVRPVAVGE
jgi:ABC-type multidrug transport system fused ATPase/permease subunit